MTSEEAARVLSEIGYLLRLEEADAHRSRAFQRAAAVLLTENPDIEALHATGALESIPSVGSGIAKVLRELVETGQSTYLDRLRSEAGEPAAPGRISLDGYRGDLHAHSTWSDGKATVEQMARAAKARGYEYMGITDHSPHMTIVHGLDGARLREQRKELLEVQERVGIRILAGIEVDILEDGSLDLPDDVLGWLDVVIASPHIKLRMEESLMTPRMLKAVEHPHVDVIGHPTGRRPGARPGAVYDYERVFKRAAENGVVMEIDCDPGRMDLSPEMARQAAALGCTLALDSDAHSPSEFEYVRLGAWMADRAGLEESQLLNWMNLAELEGRLSRG